MLMFRDFVPKQLKKAGAFKLTGEYETFESAVTAAGEWIKEEKIRPMQLETVVLPNLWGKHEDGSADPAIQDVHNTSGWHQFIRVWYDDGRDVEGHPFR